MLRLGRAAGAALRCNGAQSRYYADATKTITATLFPGDGIGPEIAEATKQVSIRAAGPDPSHAGSLKLRDGSIACINTFRGCTSSRGLCRCFMPLELPSSGTSSMSRRRLIRGRTPS